MTHLDALNLRLSNERQRLADETSASGRALRAHWVAQIEREIRDEIMFLGGSPNAHIESMSDDDLLGALA